MAAKKRDNWDEVCQLVHEDDGLPIREVGSWTEDKLWFWNRYIDIATSAMVGHPAWPNGLVYVDLFAGPGVCTVRDINRRIPGSVLIAANAPKPFRQIIACELDGELARACDSRLAASPAAGRYSLIQGDCNERIDDVVRLIPKGALTLAFIDPPGLDAHLHTLRELAACGRVDMLILFPDALDALRNVGIYTDQQESRLDMVLGADSGWRARRAALNECTGDKFRRLLATIYTEQLSALGYLRFGEEVISGPRGPLYRLLFASKHDRGLEFWNKISRRDKGGQRRAF